MCTCSALKVVHSNCFLLDFLDAPPRAARHAHNPNSSSLLICFSRILELLSIIPIDFAACVSFPNFAARVPSMQGVDIPTAMIVFPVQQKASLLRREAEHAPSQHELSLGSCGSSSKFFVFPTMGLRERPCWSEKGRLKRPGLFLTFFQPFGNLLDLNGRPFIGAF